MAQPGQTIEEQGTQEPQEPETPQRTSVPDDVPQSPTNPEPKTEFKVTRRASQATDKTQKRARRLSVPGNLLSFLTGNSRRKSGFWGDNPPFQGTKDSSAAQTAKICPSDGNESESTDKPMDRIPDFADGPSNVVADTKDEEARVETDKEEAQNLNNSSKPDQTQLPIDSTEKETLDLTKKETDTDEEKNGNVKSVDSGNNDQTFWKSLQKPAIIIDKDTTYPPSTLTALYLETPLAKKTERNEENYKYMYLDLACALKTFNSPLTVDINKSLTVEMPLNNVPEEVPDLKKAQQTTESSENDTLKEQTEAEIEEPAELETDGGTGDEMKEESFESDQDINVGTEENITTRGDHIIMKDRVIEFEDINEEHITTEVGHEDPNLRNEKSEEEESCEKDKDLCPETEERSTSKEEVNMEGGHEDEDSRNENSENVRETEDMETPTQNETTEIIDSQAPELSCQNKEEIDSDGEKNIIGNEGDAVGDQERTSLTEICSKEKEDETHSEELQTNTDSTTNVTGEQSKHLAEDTTDIPEPKLKKQEMFAAQEDKNNQERPHANGLKDLDLKPAHESNGCTPKDSNEDAIPPLSPTESLLSPGFEGVSVKQTTS